MRSLNLDDYDVYLDFLQVHPNEFDALFNSILINVTSFFRDAPTWTFARDEVLAPYIEQLPRDRSVRVWVPGCASGEEAYTVAMLLAELVGPDDFARRVKIYGTDVDEEALQKA